MQTVDGRPRLTRIEIEALEWARRIHDPAFADWDAHLIWLEQDRAHGDALNRMLLMLDRDTAALIHAREDRPAESVGTVTVAIDVANDNAPPPPARRPGRWWIGGVAAVAATALAVVGLHRTDDPVEQIVRTRIGEHRTLRLADGTTIAMNGGTGIRYAGASAREVTIDGGEAFFAVHHDAARPFAVRVGDDVIRDVGTSFNVSLGDGRVTVAVREGEVAYEAGRTPVRVTAGRQLTVYKGEAVKASVDPSAIGSWRGGRLVYRGATLAQVAADLSRSIGEPVVATPSSRLVRFTGVIVVDHDRRAMFDRVQAVTGARVTHDAAGWRLDAPVR